VHIFRNNDLFAEVSTPVNDDDISLVGFDSSSGNTMVLAKGLLKFPFEGIEAYYSPSCIGNIISEAKIRQEFHVYDKRSVNYKNDTMITDRVKGKQPSRIHWARGAEDIFVSNLRKSDKEEIISVVSLALSSKLSESEVIVEDWLGQLGLTNRETLASLNLTRLNTSVKRMEVIRACLLRLSLTEDQLDLAFAYYRSVYGREQKAPVLDDLEIMIDSLRTMSISDSARTFKRGRVDDYAGDSKSMIRKPSIPGKNDPGPNHNLKSLETRVRDDAISVSSSSVVSHSMSSLSNIVPMFVTPATAAINTTAESSLDRASSNSNSLPIDGLTKDEVSRRAKIKSSNFTRDDDSMNLNSMNEMEVKTRQSYPSAKSREDTLDSTDSMVALWLYNSNLSVQELMVSLLISEFGLATEPEIVLLSLAQQGLNKSQIDRVGQVERWHKITSFIGLKTLANMIKFRTVKELNGLSVEDVENYSKYVHESDCACNEGKLRTQPAPTFDNVQYSPDACFCDIMQLTTADKSLKFRYLVAVDALSQLIFSIPLNSLSEGDLQAAFTKLI
jgi:hypothetical protein